MSLYDNKIFRKYLNIGLFYEVEEEIYFSSLSHKEIFNRNDAKKEIVAYIKKKNNASDKEISLAKKADKLEFDELFEACNKDDGLTRKIIELSIELTDLKLL